ncbi:MAG: glycosyltransferase family 8 protein [Pseudomonadota bacterium]
MSSTRDDTSVVYCTDDSYWMPLYVSLQSLLENNPDRAFSVHIVCESIDPTFDKHAKKLTTAFQLNLRYLQADASAVKSFPLFGGLPGAVYYRLFVGSLLPECRDRTLYLDCDTVVLDRLDRLFDFDLGDSIIGAVDDAVPWVGEKLGVTPYFNSGMMLIDLHMWRKERIEEAALRFIDTEAHRIYCPDQDVLNAILDGKWKQLPNIYNFQTGHCDAHAQGRPEINPAIAHFVTGNKPWLKRSKHPFKPEFWDVLRRTPYWPYREPDRKVFGMPRKLRLWMEKSGLIRS